MRAAACSGRQTGAGLVEVLVTITIVAIGLLGLAALQMRLQVGELESYQRSQAVVLMGDMLSRLESTPAEAPQMVTTAPVGVGMDCATLDSADLALWCRKLQGAASVEASDAVQPLIGARGCIEQRQIGVTQYQVTLAWQGLIPTDAPSANVTCGEGVFTDPDTGQTDERHRRTLTGIVNLRNLAEGS
jgi:type IV pilus assembly protein PilV